MIAPTTKEIIQIIRTYAYQHGLSMSEFAKKAGISKAWLSKLKTQDREISLQLAEKILHAAGYSIIVKHQSEITDTDKKTIHVINDLELDKKDKENAEVNKLIDKNKKLLDQEQKTEGSSRLRKVVMSNNH